MAGNVRRIRRAKENGRPGKFLQSADASRGHLLRPLVLAGPVALHMRGGIVMRKIAGSERIDPHAVDRPFDAERLGEVGDRGFRSEEHTSELQSLMRSSYAVFCLKNNTTLLE